MDPVLVDLVSDPPRLVYPGGGWCPTTRNQALIEARRLLCEPVTGVLDVPVGSPVASGCGDGDAEGGEVETPHGDDPSLRENRWTDMGTYWEAEA